MLAKMEWSILKIKNMRKIILLIIALATTSAFAQKNWTKDNIGYIIEYQNSVTDYLNRYSESLRNYEDRVIEKGFNKYIEGKSNTYIQSNLLMYEQYSKATDKKIYTPSTHFSAADQQFYKTSMTKIDSTLTAMSELAKVFVEYEREKGYETDSGAKGKELIETQIALSKRFYELRKAVFDKEDETADFIFEISVKGSEHEKYLIPMNKNLNIAKQLGKLLYEVEKYDANKAKIDELRGILRKEADQFEEKRAVYKTELKHHYMDFEGYYLRLGKFVDYTEEFTDKVEENVNLLEENDFEGIGRQYNYLVDNYNHFVN